MWLNFGGEPESKPERCNGIDIERCCWRLKDRELRQLPGHWGDPAAACRTGSMPIATEESMGLASNPGRDDRPNYRVSVRPISGLGWKRLRVPRMEFARCVARTWCASWNRN